MSKFIKIFSNCQGTQVQMGTPDSPLENIPKHAPQLHQLFETIAEGSIPTKVFTSDPSIIAFLPLLRSSEVVFVPSSINRTGRIKAIDVVGALRIAGIQASSLETSLEGSLAITNEETQSETESLAA